MEEIKKYLNILKGDVQGGVVSAIVAFPQALAFGVATGMGASAGIWGAIILCFFAGIFGSKLPMISGPTGPVAIIIATVYAACSNDTNCIMSIFLMASIIQIIISFTQLPAIVKYIPYHVLSGFMNGVGTILIIMQLTPLLGLKSQSSPFENLKYLFINFNNLNTSALILGFLTLIIVFAIPKRINRIFPAQILALLVCTYISIIFNLQVDRIAQIQINIPSLHFPLLNSDILIKGLPYAMALAVICSSESMMTGLVADSLTKEKTTPKKLLASQGIGNFLCALTGSMIGSAATMRTVAAISSGALTKIAAIVSSFSLILAIVIFSDFMEQIPLTVLSGILIKIGFDIIDMKTLKVIKYAPKDDLYVLLVVFLLTVFYNLIFAIGAGITLAALLYAKRVADTTSIGVKDINDDEINQYEKELAVDFKYLIRVVHINGQFFFGSATQIVSQFEELLGTKYLVLVYESDSLLDVSAIFALEDIIIRLQSQKIKVLLVIKSKIIFKQLKDVKIHSQIGENNVFYKEKEAVEYAKTMLKKKLSEKKKDFL